ncbi:MAG TPA: hemerythrin domain-containing protein [Blastocatellia bacterium]|jgi:hemerythrin-like domain-containing protein
MPIQIGKKQESDFNNPLGLLSDCHRRIEHFLDVLIKVANQARGASLDSQQRRALTAALDYFERAAPRHTLDEEESLFPRLRARDEARAELEAIEKLHSDHGVADEMHQQIHSLARLWLDGGELSEKNTHRLVEMLNELSSLYERHIKLEDSQLFPRAARVLDPGDIEAIGREMAARRGIDFDALAKKLHG